MTDDKNIDPSRAIAIIAAVVASAAAAAEGSHSVTAAIVSAGVSTAVDHMLDEVVRWRKARGIKRLKEFVLAYVNANDGVPPDRVEATLQAIGDKLEVQNAVLEAVRGLDEALSEDAVVGLARITRLYTVTGRPVDFFFRGMRRLLQELSHAAYTDLVTALRTFKNADPSKLAYAQSDTSPFSGPEMATVIHMLKTNRLTHDDPVGVWGSSTGPYVSPERTVIEARRAVQILSIMDPDEPLRWISS